MDKHQAESLRILIRYMETRPTERLDMLNATAYCGTPACASGHAKSLPQFRDVDMNSEKDLCSVFGLGKNYRTPLYWGRLFGGALRSCMDTMDQPRNPTANEWAVEARKVLCENGYSMDEAKPLPTFARFMEKALVPVLSEYDKAEAEYDSAVETLRVNMNLPYTR